jgi:hypothetical protein
MLLFPRSSSNGNFIAVEFGHDCDVFLHLVEASSKMANGGSMKRKPFLGSSSPISLPHSLLFSFVRSFVRLFVNLLVLFFFHGLTYRCPCLLFVIVVAGEASLGAAVAAP